MLRTRQLRRPHDHRGDPPGARRPADRWTGRRPDRPARRL